MNDAKKAELLLDTRVERVRELILKLSLFPKIVLRSFLLSEILATPRNSQSCDRDFAHTSKRDKWIYKYFCPQRIN